MAVHDVRLRVADVLRQAIGERQVEVPGTEQPAYRNALLARCGVDARARRTHERAVVAMLPQRRHQVDHLLRPTIKMAPGFDVQNVHGYIIL